MDRQHDCKPCFDRTHPAIRLLRLGTLAAALAGGVGASAMDVPAASSAATESAPSACTGRADWPSRALDTADAQHVDPAQFISAAQLKTWGAELDARGLRATGSVEHARYIRALASRLRCAGVQDVHFQDVPLRRWTPENWALAVASGAAAGPVTVAGYAPYSGATPADGVTAPLAYLPAGAKPDPAIVAGHIVLLDVPTIKIPYGYFLKVALGDYATGAIDPKSIYTRPYLGMAQFAHQLDALQAAGAVGAVAIHQGDLATAHGAYFPFDHVFRRLPTLFVDESTGTRLHALADTDTKLTLTLTARTDEVMTRNLIGTIPGASSELMLLSSHTDGTNGLEDNGPDAIVGMAQYLARLPRAALPRTVMIMLNCCHFANGIGVERFIARLRSRGELDRVQANLTLEHLGALDFEPDADGALVANGRPEPGSFYLPPIRALADAAYNALRDARAGPATVLPPVNPDADGRTDKVWPGDGQNYWAFARLPTANYATGPYYLLNWGIDTVDKIDFARMHREMVAFTQMLLELSRVPPGELRTVSEAGFHTVGSGTPAPDRH